MTEAVDRGEVEARVRTACERGDLDAAVTAAIEAYGPEILGFLVARMGDNEDTREVFSDFCEDLFRGLPQFEWRCTLRGWAYTLARHAEHHFLREPGRRRERNLTLPRDSRCSKLVYRLRTETTPYQRTEVKERIRALRDLLSDDDHTLLILRIDRGLSWEDLANVMNAGDTALSSDELTTASARLRKRFERVKERLRILAEADGLIETV